MSRFFRILLACVIVTAAWVWSSSEARSDAEKATLNAAPEASKPAEKEPFPTFREKLSYSIGMNIGSNIKQQQVDIDLDLMVKAIKDVLAGGKTAMTEEQVRDTFMAWQKEMRANFEKKQKELGEKNKKEGEAYLAENKKKDGWKTLPSGLQYKPVKEGEGVNPKETDTVKVHYKGTLIDGTEFDSSYGRGEPAKFPVRGVIKGWTEALQIMKPGAKYQLCIPSELAYGERGGGAKIGPHAVLLFDVELISIEPPTTKPASPNTLKVTPATKPASDE